MSTNQRSTALYPHPFSKAYWRDAAAELKSTKMLVITALLIALRIALKPLAIPLGPQLSIQTAMLATALGAMVYGPVMAIPAAIISDTIGFLIYPTGDYFLPFVLTEIASTLCYALCLYRAKPTALRVTLSRFLICFFVNVVLQQVIFAWYYVYIGNPESAKAQILGIMTVARIFKNLCFFPIESVVLTLFLGLLMPAVQRANLVHTREHELKFKPKQIVALVCLLAVGISSSIGYLTYRYSPEGEGKSRSADYTDVQRVEANKAMTQVVTEKENFPDTWTNSGIVGIVDSAYRGFWEEETDYAVSIYVVFPANFKKGQAEDENYTMETLWGYSKSGPKKDKYQSLLYAGTATFTMNEKTQEVTDYVWKASATPPLNGLIVDTQN